MRTLFGSELAAFCYLLFVLLYMPCVATIGVIYKEQGAYWAVFSAGWSLGIAYASAVTVYQIGHIQEAPLTAIAWCGAALGFAGAMLAGLVHYGKRRVPELIPVVSLD